MFWPNLDNLRGALRLCLCEQYKVNYEDCDLFSDFPLSVIELNQKNLWHGNNEERDLSSLNNLNNFIIENTFVAVAADELSPNSNWFIKVVQRKCVSNENATDDCSHTIPAGFKYIKGHFLEQVKTTKSFQIFKISSKFTYFYSESVVYPFVNINEIDKGHLPENKDLTDILHFTGEHGLVPLETKFSFYFFL